MPPTNLDTGLSVRLATRSGHITSQTSSLAPGYIQSNLIVLPSAYAADFRSLCQRNPIPCPLLAESARSGCSDRLKSYILGISGDELAKNIDLRRDFPRYVVYRDGEVDASKSGIAEVVEEWRDDHVAFLIGCSFSFENALSAAGLPPSHVTYGRNVPMYRTTRLLNPAGMFTEGTYVMSMRFYCAQDVERVRQVTRPFGLTHGEPIAWGWDALTELGIVDLTRPEFGDAPILPDGTIFEENMVERIKKGEDDDKNNISPVFWGCGVTPQDVVRKAGLKGVVIGHQPGHMLVLDIKDMDIVMKR
jgi:uncharacterized protein YcsI (UPF0317 family)